VGNEGNRSTRPAKPAPKGWNAGTPPGVAANTANELFLPEDVGGLVVE